MLSLCAFNIFIFQYLHLNQDQTYLKLLSILAKQLFYYGLANAKPPESLHTELKKNLPCWGQKSYHTDFNN